jgi:geranylgeranyl pyrophosphate synthase
LTDRAPPDGPSQLVLSMAEQVDEELLSLVAREADGSPEDVAALVQRAVLSPGKRIRPILLLGAYRAVGGDWPDAALLSCSVELVHAYSLVHDDLPCMDDDVLRRGRPTLHVEFGVEAATLAGAVLMPLAVRTICRAGDRMGLSDETTGRLVETLTIASGGRGMVGGQLMDLAAEGRDVSAEELEAIHLGKTAALIAASVTMGAIAGGADEDTIAHLDVFGLRLGLAFQTVDDILDLTGSDAELGKMSGRDEALSKATYPALFGLEGAERFSRRLAEVASRELSIVPNGDVLQDIVEYVIERTH